MRRGSPPGVPDALAGGQAFIGQRRQRDTSSWSRVGIHTPSVRNPESETSVPGGGRNVCVGSAPRQFATSRSSHTAHSGSPISTPAQFSPVQSALGRARAPGRGPAVRYLVGVVVLAAAYYGSAKVGQTLRYTASVAAIWPPAGLGSPRSTSGECAGGRASSSRSSSSRRAARRPASCRSGAWWVSRRATWPRSSWALSCCGGSSARARRAIAGSRSAGCSRPWRSRRRSARPWGWCRCWPVESSSRVRPTFWRTWWLGDFAGALVVVPLVLAWASDPALPGGVCGPLRAPCCSLLWRPSVRSPCPPASRSPMWSSPR